MKNNCSLLTLIPFKTIQPLLPNHKDIANNYENNSEEVSHILCDVIK